jgi:hypothetical protein
LSLPEEYLAHKGAAPRVIHDLSCCSIDTYNADYATVATHYLDCVVSVVGCCYSYCGSRVVCVEVLLCVGFCLT